MSYDISQNRKVDYLKITDAAISELNSKISVKDSNDIIGIKLGVKTKGCSGLAYDVCFATIDNVSKYDELLDSDKIKLFIDPKVSLFLFGTEMDYVHKKTKTGIIMESGFVFNNPNETGKCGCGESFYV